MRVAKGLVVVTVAAAIGAACLWQFGCDENPTGPKPYKPKDYVLYWNNTGYGPTCYAYHTLSRRLDTFNIPADRIWDMKASADGKRLFVRYSEKISVISTTDWYTIADLPYPGLWGLAVSPDDRYLALHGGSLRVLSACDYSLLFLDTLTMNNGVFSANGKRYYAPGPTSTCCSVYRLDLENEFKVDYICVPDGYRIASVVPSIDERYLFMFRDIGDCDMLFDVFDVAGDSLFFRDLVIPGCGDMVVSRDNQYVYFTGPGSILIGSPPVYTFARFSLREAKIDSLLYWSTYCGLDISTGIIGDNIVMIPDGRLLAVSEFTGLNRLVIYDCLKRDTVAVECWIGAGFHYLTCQNGK